MVRRTPKIDGKVRAEEDEEEDSELSPYQEYFEALAFKHKIAGNPFLEQEDLLQEIFLISLQIERDYGDRPNFDKILARATKLHVLTLIRDHWGTPKRFEEKIRLMGKELLEERLEIEAEIEIESFEYALKQRLSPDALRVFSEIESPSEKTLQIAEERRLRKAHLRAQGHHVYNADTIKISGEIIRTSLNLSLTRYTKCRKEIRDKARKLKEEIERETK